VIHVLTGDGAGKTTSSIGHLIRALGHDGRGLIIQFYKNDRNAGDYKFFFEKHPSARVDIIQYGTKCLNPEMRREQRCSQCGECMQDKKLLRRRVLSAIKKLRERVEYYDSIVLDEVLVAYSFGHISRREIEDIVRMAPEKEWYLTGRLFGCKICKSRYRYMVDTLLCNEEKQKEIGFAGCGNFVPISEFGVPTRGIPAWLYDLADYITLMVEVKHPFRQGVPARLGVEW